MQILMGIEWLFMHLYLWRLKRRLELNLNACLVGILIIEFLTDQMGSMREK